MNKRTPFLGLAAACLFAGAAVTGLGCSPKSDALGEPGSLSQKSPLENECERELLYLDRLIESRRNVRDFPVVAMAEAVELRRLAVELILEEEYALALELIDEAVTILSTHV